MFSKMALTARHGTGVVSSRRLKSQGVSLTSLEFVADEIHLLAGDLLGVPEDSGCIAGK